MKKISCPLCDDKFISIDGVHEHIEDEHSDNIPEDYSVARYMYYLKTGKSHGTCVICKRDTDWNETSNKYNRMCNDPKCKEKYIAVFKKRMVGKYGKVSLLNDPDHQRKMLAGRKISGEYKWSDNSKKTYTGSYELEFLKFLDIFMNWDGNDIITPSPHTYTYIYEKERHFYIPDVYIPSLNLEIEIKQGGNNPNMHPNMVKIDKVKENLKDDVMKSQTDTKYIKIIDKNYDGFFDFLNNEKESYINSKNVNFGNIIKENIDILDSGLINDDSIEFLQESFNNLIVSILDSEEPVYEATDSKLYPVYICLFSNNTDFAKLIRKVTGSEYSHATISLDSSLNDMYSFSDIPYNHNEFSGAGFVRESIWSPMYGKNRYFTILVTFVDEDGKQSIENKIAYFKSRYYEYKYNDIGLIQYYLNFKNTKRHDETRKMKWFCSEFVSYMVSTGQHVEFEDILKSPSDLFTINNSYNLGNFTINTFNESDLVKKTAIAKREFIKSRDVAESIGNEYVSEAAIIDTIKGFIEKNKINKEITKYTALLDWKYLYDEFTKIFTNTTPVIRFDLFELIIIKVILPLKINADDTMKYIVSEMKRIRDKIHTDRILSVNQDNSTIETFIKGVYQSYKYPNF